MLRLLLGPSGTGKTAWLHRKALELASQGKKVFLIVPEQYSFETEKAVGSFPLGGGERVEAVSFSRLCNLIFREFGGLSGETLTDCGRIMLMSMVLEEVGPALSVYARQAGSVPFAAKALSILDEFRNCALSPQDVQDLSEEMETGSIGEKLRDLALIYSTYEAMLTRGRHDARGEMMRALELVKNTGFFQDAAVILDGFFSFPKVEILLIECMLSQAQEVYVSLCCDGLVESPARAFEVGRKTAQRLLRMAKGMGVPAAAPILLTEPHRFKEKALAHVARCFPFPTGEGCEGNDGSVEVAQAPSRYEEVRFVAASLRRMVREEGLRYRDAVIILRSTEEYQALIEDVFSRYEIPFFMDQRVEVQYMPLMTLVTSLIEISRGNFATPDIFRHLKTYLRPIEPESIYALEGYCLLWGIDHSAWLRPFQHNPAGMEPRMGEEQLIQLEELEVLRQTVVEPLAAFREKVKGKLTGEVFARAVFDYLEQVEIPSQIQALGEEYERRGEKSRADELFACWEVLMGLLEQFSTVLGGQDLGLARLGELLQMAIIGSDLGHIPQTLDQATIGSADRIRPSAPKVTVVMGANEGSFPLSVPPQSLISQRERLLINRQGKPVLDTMEERFDQELTYIYTAVTSPSHKLILTYPVGDAQGKPLFPAPFVQQVEKLVCGLAPVEVAALSPMALLENESSAMDLLAEHLGEDTSLTASLIQSVGQKKKEEVESLFQILERRPYALEDGENTRQLLGNLLRFSPSRLDRYYSCPFQYFCQDMLRIRPQKRAEFSPIQSGTVIHHLLEQMVSRHGARGLSALSRAQLTEEVNGLLREYLLSALGEEIPRRMGYLFTRLADTLVRLLVQLGREFAQSEFVPTDFELPISQSSENRPMELRAKTGERIWVEGVVDRVDMAVVRGKKYLRVVDYKSGVKQFSLSDVAYGLNMQMLIYLFSLWENGTGKYQDCYPAGVLYLPAKSEIISADRHLSREEMEKAHQKTMRMNGLILEDNEVVEAMEQGAGGIFIPAKRKKDGEFDKASSLMSLARFGKLKRHVEDQIIAMADALRAGKIQAQPVEQGGSLACSYCDYQSVCKREEEEGTNPLPSLEREEFYERLDARYAEEG